MLPELEKRYDVRVVELCKRLRLAHEAIRKRGIVFQIRRQNLERVVVREIRRRRAGHDSVQRDVRQRKADAENLQRGRQINDGHARV